MKLPTKRLRIIALLRCLGFVEQSNSGRGDHIKFIHPSRNPIVQNQPPFIMVPRHDFEHGRFGNVIHRELVGFGFSKKEINDCC